MLLLQLLGQYSITVCEALGAIGGFQPRTLVPLFPDILHKLTELSNCGELTSEQNQVKVMMCTLIFQSLSIYESTKDIDNVISYVISKNDSWANYRIARSAARYGHHNIANIIFNGLTEQVSSEHLHFWLVSLKEITEAEAQLASMQSSKNSLVESLDLAVVHYNKAIAALKVNSKLIFVLF